MNYEIIFFAYVLCVLAPLSEGKICTSVEIKLNPSHFEKLKNCSKIVGYLRIIRFEHYAENLPTFPNLIEVTGHIILYEIPTLTSVGDIFPNLRIIRGKVLFREAALVLYLNRNVVNIGLGNLLAIQRGNIVVYHCLKLCYMNTVNWGRLGTSLSFFEKQQSCQNEACHPDCGGYCWAENKCQQFYTECHPECVGCHKNNSPNDCIVCKNYNNNGTCVQKCPSDKFINGDAFTCDTKEECENLGKYYVTFKNLCIHNCFKNYQLVINGTSKVCIPCNTTSCSKIMYCNSITITKITDIEYLRECTHVEGNLEIKLTNFTLLSYLEKYLADVQEIKGCLKVFDSSALESLDFLKNLRTIKGKYKESCNKRSIYIHNNINLKKLWHVDKNFSLMSPTKESIEFHDNPLLCLTSIGEFAKGIGVSFDDVNELKYVSLNTNGDEAICKILDIDVVLQDINFDNAVICWKLSASYNFTPMGYAVFYTSYTNPLNAHIDAKEVCSSIWISIFVEKNCYNITGLLPFTTYHYYIKVYSTLKVEGTSNIRKFKTPSGYPSQPKKFNINSTSTSLILTWLPPSTPNGNISHYHVSLRYKEEDKTLIKNRNYCKFPHQIEPSKIYNTNKSIKTCDCEEEDLCLNDDPFISTECDVPDFFVEHKRLPIYDNSIHINIHSNETLYEIRNLSHFSTYVIEFSACNKDFDESLLCSRPLLETIRTKSTISADNITEFTVKVENNNVLVIWTNPKTPNGLLVSYNIQYNKSEIGKFYIPICVNALEPNERNRSLRIGNLDPGYYSIKIKAISLAGDGYYTQNKYFTITSPSESWILYILIALIIFIVLLVSSVYIWYKNRVSIKNVRLIANINPDYESSAYFEDEWEIDRNDVEIRDEIGRGTFGLVYNGIVLSKNKLCAIKTLNDNASQNYRLNFLNEASVMKSFSEAHHVVKLFGVVSRGEPPLVVMELMERGDLKQYLRNSRESSRVITTNEMYLMLGQIADGMAYLSAKKFVHRDLAARNCMVGLDCTVKIGDFGMTRDIYETDYYKKGTKGLLPIRWMAPESLADGIFTSNSDVWSFGIVLWEIVTLAEQPYQGMTNEQVLNFVISYGKLYRPPECPNLIYEIMESCWDYNPRDRPNFIEIVDLISPLLGPTFNLVSFCYSRAGKEYRLLSRTNFHDRERNSERLNEEYLELNQFLS